MSIQATASGPSPEKPSMSVQLRWGAVGSAGLEKLKTQVSPIQEYP